MSDQTSSIATKATSSQSLVLGGRNPQGKFSKGNEFWRARTRHGRKRLFASPDLLWESACKYFEWCEGNPLMKLQYVGKDATPVEIPKMRPFTKKGLCLFLGVNSKYLQDAKDSGDSDLGSVISRIEDIIYDQKFSGAAAGFFNANLIIRDLALANKQEIRIPSRVEVSYVGPQEEYV